MNRRHARRSGARTSAARAWVVVAVCVALRAPAALAQGALDPPALAVHDDARALFGNPAAVGVRHASEALFAWSRQDAAREWGAVALTAGGVGAFATREPGDVRTLGFALRAGGEPLRVGWRSRWLVRDAGGREVRHDAALGVLARPLPWLSAAAGADHLGQPTFGGRRIEREWSAGLALRPLAWSRANAYERGPRLTLWSDVSLREGASASSARVRVGLEAEPLDGLVLRGAVSDHGGVQAGITLRGLGATLHGGGASTRVGDRWVRGAAGGALSLHGSEERTVLRTSRARRVAEVRASGVLADEPGGASLLGGGGAVSSRWLHRQLERALEDPLTRGVLLDLRGVGGMAQIEELRPRLERLKAVGKPVVAWMEYGGGRGALALASAASRVVASEEASFGPLGLRVEKRYWKEPLARAGVRVDRSSVGAFKSAYREWSVDSIPAADSLAIEHVLDQSQEMFVAALESGRGVPRARFEPLLDGREYDGRDLVRAGLVDTVGWREDALRELGRLTGLGEKPRTRRGGAPAVRAWSVPSRIAIVWASGGIVVGRSGNDLLEGPTLGHATLIAQLERACRRSDVRAVVLRIDSPGGATLASGLMAHAVERIKRETKRPIVVSMAGVAASGGYDLACNADWIVANRATRTGSIGVLFVKPSVEQLYRRLGVHEDAFARGDYMQGWSPAHDWDARLQAAADSSVTRLYERFVNRVAKGRGLETSHVLAVAQGRVWLGDEAKTHRLVDAIGGLDDAIAEARRRAGVPEGEKLRPIEYHRPRGAFLQRALGALLRESLARELSLESLKGGTFARDDRLEGVLE